MGVKSKMANMNQNMSQKQDGRLYKGISLFNSVFYLAFLNRCYFTRWFVLGLDIIETKYLKTSFSTPHPKSDMLTKQMYLLGH